jgi:hypothetical protein
MKQDTVADLNPPEVLKALKLWQDDKTTPAKKSKYNAKKTIVNGITFDSGAEAARYQELRILEMTGQISGLKLQPQYELQPKFKHDGKTVQAIYYVGDFEYWENGQLVVDDCKGVLTPVFQLKSKLFRYKYPHIELRISGASSNKKKASTPGRKKRPSKERSLSPRLRSEHHLQG